MKNKIIQLIENGVKIIGAFGLIAIMLAVSISVAGRHLGIPVPGSVEIAELLIILVAASSYIYTSINNKHASASFFVDHVSIEVRKYLARLQTLFAIILGAGLSVGNFWLIVDVWSLDEASFLLGIPIVPFRIVWFGSTFLVTVYLLLNLFSSKIDVSGDIEF